MKSRDAVIGFIFLVILIAGVLWIFRNRNIKNNNVPTPTPTISERVNNAFPSLKVPEGANRADLNNVGGREGVGVATRQKTADTYEITVLANLPQTANGNYTAELAGANDKLTLGTLTQTKSGFVVDFSTTRDISAYNKVTVMLNGSPVLEGSF